MLGLVIVPLYQAFGWSRGEVSAGLLILCSGVLVFGPTLRPLIARWGLRRVVMGGILLFAAAMALVGSSGPSVISWYLAWGLVAVAFPAVSAIVWTLNLGLWFERNRGLAFGIALSGVGVAGFIGPLIGGQLLEAFGWRAVYFAISAFALLVALPTTFFLLRERAEPDGGRVQQAGAVPNYWTALVEMLRRPAFAQLLVAMALAALGIGSLFVHFQPMMVDAGISSVEAASYAAIMGPFMLLGRIGGGFLLDRLPLALVAGVAFLLPAGAAALLFFFDATPWQCVCVAAILGLANGIETDVLAFMVAKLFGLHDYSAVYSLAYGVYALFFGLAPVIAGVVFDYTGAYQSLLLAVLAGLLLSTVLVVLTAARGAPKAALEG